jgi:hypothetical protein
MWLQVLLAHFGVIGRRYEPVLQGLIAQDREEDYILDHVECALRMKFYGCLQKILYI